MSTLPVSLSEAILGAKEKVPTPSGAVTMTLPKWANTGSVLRLKGKGVPRVDGSRGDELVTLKVVLPESPIRNWRNSSPIGAVPTAHTKPWRRDFGDVNLET